jgi:hypothetical protein
MELMMWRMPIRLAVAFVMDDAETTARRGGGGPRRDRGSW